MNIEQRDDLSLAADTVGAGGNLEVVGSNGSGRSTFLKELGEMLEADGWKTVSVRGVATLKQFSLAALNLPGRVEAGSETRGVALLHQATAALQAKVSAPRSVIIVDDWDELDEASRGVIESVQREHSVPLVFSRLQDARAKHASEPSVASHVPADFVVTMRPLKVEALGEALKAHLGAPVGRRTLSRIYAMTGGHIGLALAVTKIARRESQLTKDAYGVWTSSGDLWSPSLVPALELYLRGLPEFARESLEILASVGTVRLDTARRLVDDPSLELLEERGLTQVLSGSLRNWVTIVPPLLGEYFRRAPATARRMRLKEHVLDRIGEVEPIAAVVAESSASAEIVDGSEALFAALAREQVRTKISLTAAEWEASRTPRNAIDYITALMQSHQPDSEGFVEQVFRDTDSSLGDLESQAELLALHANCLAHVQANVDEALQLLRVDRDSYGVFGRLLDAAELTILTNLVGVPADAIKTLEVTGNLPPRVQLALLEAQMLIFVASCRFNEARQTFERIRVLDPEIERIKPRALYGFVLLGEGRHSEALRLLTSWFETAREEVDVQSVRAFSCALALCHSQSGDQIALDALAEVMATVGGPTRFPSNPPLATLAVTTSVVSARQGDTLFVERFVSEAQRREFADGPLPAQSLAWPVAQLMILQGKVESAADELWNSGEKLWARQAYYAGMLQLLVSIEIHPDAKRLARAHELLKLVPESVSLRAQERYVAALVQEDPEVLMLGAEALVSAGRFGLAVSAYEKAGLWFERAGDNDRSEEALELANQARSRICAEALDVSRFNSLPAVLSHREEQVAKLVADGLTNKDIAGALFLSVRTVDGHISRIFRKLKLKNRRELEDYFTYSQAGPSAARTTRW